MSNLLVTERCNRKCSFCFARNRLQGKHVERNMSLEDIRKVMGFLKRSNEKSLRLLGGEPTLHPDFKTIVEEALAEDFHVFIFSNCITSPELVDYLASIPPDRMAFLCNISPQASDTTLQIEQREYALAKLGSRVTLGITVTSPEFEFAFLIETIQRFQLRKHIRVGVAQPIIGQDNVYLPPTLYREAGRAIATMARECIKHDILIGFDCGMTLCMFSTEELGMLMTCSEGFTSVCGPIIDVGLNLEVWSCFPLSEILMTHIEDFNNRREIVRFYERVLGPYRSLGCQPKCLQCDYKRRGQCFGGCLAHNLNSLNKLPPRYADLSG